MKSLELWVVWLMVTAAGVASETTHDTAELEYFEKKIRPILAARCFECHSADAKHIRGGLRLDTAAAVATGGDSGPAVVPGKPAESLLLEAIGYGSDDIQMPPTGRLPEHEIAELTRWVLRGAAFPGEVVTREPGHGTIDFTAARRFWSFQPVRMRPLPHVADTNWPRERMDFFVLAQLERVGLTPSPPADRRRLLRRLSFDLVGLPPSPAEVERFVNDKRPDAYAREVDRLLASPRFGERWARMWLDLARYTDKTASWLHSTGQAYRYRDWVVDAMNKDMPYPEFVKRQLATDLLVETGPDDLPALGFLGLSPNYWKELQLPAEIIKVIVADEWEERVDAVSRTFLGLTVACARCHDHKFDPISTRDYYALAGVFASCRLAERPLIQEALFEPIRRARSEVQQLEQKISELKKAKPPAKEKLAELSAKIEHLKTTTPGYDTPMANAVTEESLYVVRAGEKPEDGTKLDYRTGPRDLHVFIRGNPNRLGELVPRGFLEVFSSGTVRPFRQGSGRLELAEAITTQAAALTARVIVNRIWLAHFGRGIVTTPSNFGELGERPSHPDLLDDLAARFIAEGWSLQWLHREIVRSSTYRQSSRNDPVGADVDADNRWLWRMNRRRLDVESWRDAMLWASGQLDGRIGGSSIDWEADGNRRRTLYATIHRREMSPTLLTYDFPDPIAHSPQRLTTTTAMQGLYLLNGPLLANQSRALSRRLAAEKVADDRAIIQRAYQLLYARNPTQREVQLSLAFLADHAEGSRREAWEQYAHVLLASNEFLYVD